MKILASNVWWSRQNQVYRKSIFFVTELQLFTLHCILFSSESSCDFQSRLWFQSRWVFFFFFVFWPRKTVTSQTVINLTWVCSQCNLGFLQRDLNSSANLSGNPNTWQPSLMGIKGLRTIQFTGFRIQMYCSQTNIWKWVCMKDWSYHPYYSNPRHLGNSHTCLLILYAKRTKTLICLLSLLPFTQNFTAKVSTSFLIAPMVLIHLSSVAALSLQGQGGPQEYWAQGGNTLQMGCQFITEHHDYAFRHLGAI